MDLRLYAVGIPAVLNLALPSLLISALNGILASYSQMYVVILGNLLQAADFSRSAGQTESFRACGR